MKRITKVLCSVVLLVSAFAIGRHENVYAIMPSTQAELDKANANLIRIENEMKQAYDYWDECKAKLEQANATGDVNAMYYADLECKRSEDMVEWYIGQYSNAKRYLDTVKTNISWEETKEDYTNYIKKRGEADVAAGAYTQAMEYLKTAKALLDQTEQSVKDLNALLPTHPELQDIINAKSALIPALKADIALKEASVNAAKLVYDAKKEELKSFSDIVWTYGDHHIYSYYSAPFIPTEKLW